jgi:hypothetical protein
MRHVLVGEGGKMKKVLKRVVREFFWGVDLLTMIVGILLMIPVFILLSPCISYDWLREWSQREEKE